jgi:hypothetical protein
MDHRADAPAGEALAIGDLRVTARHLAEARQQLAHEGTGYCPPWNGLTPDEQQVSITDAGNYLRALSTLMPSNVGMLAGLAMTALHDTFRTAIMNAAVLHGWTIARQRGVSGGDCEDIVQAAMDGVYERLATWGSQAHQ